MVVDIHEDDSMVVDHQNFQQQHSTPATTAPASPIVPQPNDHFSVVNTSAGAI